MRAKIIPANSGFFAVWPDGSSLPIIAWKITSESESEFVIPIDINGDIAPAVEDPGIMLPTGVIVADLGIGEHFHNINDYVAHMKAREDAK